MQSQKDSAIDPEQWDGLKPNTSNRDPLDSAAFPILDHFAGNRLGRELEEVLTVTETSRGLNFEYIWEAAKHDHFEYGQATSDEGMTYTNIFFPVEVFENTLSEQGSGAQDESGQESLLRVPEELAVFNAHKPSVGSDYYIQLEEKSGGIHGNLDNQAAILVMEEDGHQASADRNSHFMVLGDFDAAESTTDGKLVGYNTDSKKELINGPESPFQNIFSSLASMGQSTSPKNQIELTDLSDIHLELEMAPCLNLEPTELSHPKKGTPGHVSEMEGVYSPEDLVQHSDPSQLTPEELSDNFHFLQERNLLKGILSSEAGGGDFSGAPDTAEMLATPNRNSLGVEAKMTANTPTHKDEHCVQLGTSVSLGVPPQSLVESQVPSSSPVVDTQQIASPLRDGKELSNVGVDDSTICSIDYSYLGMDPISEAASVETLSLNAKNKTNGNSHCLSTILDGEAQESPPKNQELNYGDNRWELIHELDKKQSGLERGDGCLRRNSGTSARVQELDSEVLKEVGLPSVLPSDRISQDSLLEDSLSTPMQSMGQSIDTPDSLDSLDVNEVLESLVSPQSPQKLLPPDKPADSGYETENLESPEWTSHLIGSDSNEESALPVAGHDGLLHDNPVIVVSAAVSADSCAANTDHFGTATKTTLGGLQNSYRDSAYFSDNDSELDKKSEEVVNTAAGPKPKTPAEGIGREYFEMEKDASAADRPNYNVVADGPFGNNSCSQQELAERLKIGGQEGPHEDAGTTLLPPVLELESSNDDDIEIFEDCPRSVSCMGTNTADFVPERDLKIVANSYGPAEAYEKSLCHLDGHKLKEPDIEGKYLGKLDVTGMLGLSLDGDDADEEDENSDDSEDDMRTFHLHGLSSDSDEEMVHPVPVILSNSDDGQHLRSLLKCPKLFGQNSPREALSKDERKAVTFFDDVTVYLFDQVLQDVGSPLRCVPV